MARRDELQELFNLQGETLATEFKDWLDLSDSRGKATIAKAAIALANHGGGTIVFGMGGKPPVSVSRPQGMPRYTTDAVNAAVNRYADPHIHCDVDFLVHPISKHEHAFVNVPGGHEVPIMSVRELTGVIASQRCYIRKAGPKSEEPYTSAEWRALLNACVRAGRESLLDSIRIIMRGQSLAPVGEIDRLEEYRKASFDRWKIRTEKLPPDDPARFKHGYYEQTYQLLDVPPAADLSDLRNRLRQADEIKHTGWGPFVDLGRRPLAPVPAGDSIEAWVGNPVDGVSDRRHSDFWRAHPEGLLYEIRSFDEDFSDRVRPGTALDLIIPIWRIGETLLYVARFARLYWDDPEINIFVEYTGLMNRKMKSLYESRYLSYERECIVDKVRMRGQARASEMVDNTAEVLLPLLKPLYEAFDFAPLGSGLISEELAKFRNKRY